MKRMILIASAALLTLPSLGCTSEEAQNIATLEGDATAGKPLYDSMCAGCHGADGKGGSYDVDLVAELHHSDEEIIDVILSGDGDMPAYSDQLSDQEIADVVAHVRVTLGGQ